MDKLMNRFEVASSPLSPTICQLLKAQCNMSGDCTLPINQRTPTSPTFVDRSLVSFRRRNPSQDSFSSSAFSMVIEQEDYHFAETSHPLQVLTGLNSLRLSGLFCDITLCVDGQEFHCHKIVLASFSAYFKAMFACDLAESQQDRVSLNGVESDMIKLLVDYGYTSEVTITRNNVQSLLSAANLLEILPVRDACCQFMERNMDETNCVGVHCFAEAHACYDLQAKAKTFTLKYFADVVMQDEFTTLPQCKMIEFLSDDALTMEKEEDVFLSVMRWLNHSPEERRENFEKVLEHVRLPLLSPYFLVDSVAKEEVVQKSKACLALLEEAKTFHLLPDRRLQLQSIRTRPRKSSGMATVIVAVGGEDDKVVLRSVESYEPRTRLWKSLTCLPFAVSKHGLVVSGSNMIYMAGGEFPDGLASRSMWRYDPVFDSWQEMASMHMNRSELGLVILDGNMYAVGGWEGSLRLDSVEKYDLRTNTWEFVAPLKMAVTSPAVVAYNGFLYVTGGAVLEDGDGIDLVQCYNPNTNCWTELCPMLIPRSGSAACVVNNLIYVIGGWHASTENTSKVECYDPAKNEWTHKAAMKERRYRPGVAVVDGKVYVCGGEEGWDRYHDTMECYDDENDVWNIVGEMPTSRSWLSCVPMQVPRESASTRNKDNT